MGAMICLELVQMQKRKQIQSRLPLKGCFLMMMMMITWILEVEKRLLLLKAQVADFFQTMMKMINQQQQVLLNLHRKKVHCLTIQVKKVMVAMIHCEEDQQLRLGVMVVVVVYFLILMMVILMEDYLVEFEGDDNMSNQNI